MSSPAFTTMLSDPSDSRCEVHLGYQVLILPALLVGGMPLSSRKAAAPGAQTSGQSEVFTLQSIGFETTTRRVETVSCAGNSAKSSFPSRYFYQLRHQFPIFRPDRPLSFSQGKALSLCLEISSIEGRWRAVIHQTWLHSYGLERPLVLLLVSFPVL